MKPELGVGGQPENATEAYVLVGMVLEKLLNAHPEAYSDGDISNTLKRVGFWLIDRKNDEIVVKWQIQCRSKTLPDLLWEPVYVELGEKIVIQRTTGKNREFEPDEIVKRHIYHYDSLEGAQAAFDRYLERSRGFPNLIARMITGSQDFLKQFEVRFVPVQETGSVPYSFVTYNPVKTP